MTIKDFIKEFSHNNSIYVENKNNYRMQYRYNQNSKLQDKLIDWEIEFTNISDCDIICISQVYDSDGRFRAITLKIDTELTEFIFDKEKISLKYAPLWLYEEVHETKINAYVCESEL